MKTLFRSLPILIATALHLPASAHADEKLEPGFKALFNGSDLSGWDGDADEINFRADGLIGFQLHSGQPMKIEIKHIRIRELKKK